MFPQRLDSTVAYGIARAMMDGFNRHYRLFRAESARAKHRFETADWHAQQRGHGHLLDGRRGAVGVEEQHLHSGASHEAGPASVEVGAAVGDRESAGCSGRGGRDRHGTRGGVGRQTGHRTLGHAVKESQRKFE